MMNAKKHILLSLITLFFLGFTSCSGDDEPVDPLLIDNNQNGGGGNNGGGDSSSVSGVYVMTAFNSSVPIDLNADGTASVNQLDESDCFNNSFLTLNQNNTFVSESKGIEIDFMFDSQTGEETSTIICYEEEDSNGTWAVDGNEVIFTYVVDGETFSDTFVKEGNQLIFTVEDGSVIGTTDQGTPVYLTSTIEIIYTKQ
jgi:hypothetical protein